MPNALRYPRGFTASLVMYPTIADIRTAEDIDADAEVATLYNMYLSRNVQGDSWGFRARVIEAAARLFGDFRLWCVLQAAHNDHVYELNFDYIVDTLNFIRTGDRTISALTMKELLLERPNARHGVATPARAERLGVADPKEFENFLGKWIAYEDGFEDLLLTLHVFFGRAKRPE